MAAATTQMPYAYLGRSGLRVSRLSLGAWITYGGQEQLFQVDEEAIALECMQKAFEHGVNFFDNAEVYAAGRAETVMGNCIKKAGWRRSDIVISTKIFWGPPPRTPNTIGLSRKHIVEGTDACLKRLGLEYVDVISAHRSDQQTPMEETVRAFNHVIDQGKALYWGTSEWSAEEIQRAQKIADRLGLVGPICEQPQYSMLHRTRFEKEYRGLYTEHGLGTTIWSPLACGLLTGKYTSTKREDFPKDSRLGNPKGDADWLAKQLVEGEGMNGLEEKDLTKILKKVDNLKPIAAELGCTLAQLALAWCLKNPNVTTVITGASRASQVEENMKSLQVEAKLTPAVMERIEKVLENKPFTGKDPKWW